MTADIGQRRCFHHAGREAVGRCTVCRRDFCAECVTDHEDRLVCARCLAGLAVTRSGAGGRLRRMGAVLSTAALMLAGWCLFFLLLRAIAALPVAVHEAGSKPEPGAVEVSP